MFRRNGKEIKKENLNIIFNDGGLGDHICRMTAVKYIKEKCPHIKIYLYVPDFFLETA